MTRSTQRHHSDPWGGLLDGLAIGLGVGCLSLLLTVKSPAALIAQCPASIPEMVPFIIGSVIVGALAGYAWGRSRGY